MKGDFSRIRFNPAKQYTAVLQQQGRVALDSDANEEVAIEAHLRETTTVDVVGQFGGPIGDAGFEIGILGEEIFIQPGRYYVDGLLVENPKILNYDNQPFLENPNYSARDLLTEVLRGGTAQFRLEVWQRLVTELDDPCLQEPALGQADTTVRLQTVWRVVGTVTTENQGGAIGVGNLTRLELSSSGSFKGSSYADPISRLSPCCQLMYGQVSRARTGAMGADTSESGDDCGCDPVPAAGYQGLENQLYRVEIHEPGDITTATFKWSRENGSVLAQVTQASGPVIKVSSLGPDANLGFLPGQWVELSDDNDLFGEIPNQPGKLYQILSTSPATLQVTLTASVVGLDTSRNARMRRWEQNGSTATSTGVALSASAVALENGIEVTFHGGNYHAGDYWTIPARTATGRIEWPPCGGDGLFYQPSKYTRIHVAPLACVHARTREQYTELYSAKFNLNQKFAIEDCRLLFPPLTALQSNAVDAIHVSATSWTNDEVVTVDALLENGLNVTFDQAPNCPWGGGNFRVTLERPVSKELGTTFNVAALPQMDGTDVFLRSEVVLDPPEGIFVTGAKVNWLLPLGKSKASQWLYRVLNTLVGPGTSGYARVRVKLAGGSVFAAGTDGNAIYLDGTGLGETGTRSSDGKPSVVLSLPSGQSEKAGDFESWFYLAPTVLIAGVAIQAVEANGPVAADTVTVLVNPKGRMTGLQTGTGAAVVAVKSMQAAITLSYAPVADTTIALTLSGTGVGSVVSIQATVVVPKGQISTTVPIHIAASPGNRTTDTVTLEASVETALGNFPWASPPRLSIKGTSARVIGK